MYTPQLVLFPSLNSLLCLWELILQVSSDDLTWKGDLVKCTANVLKAGIKCVAGFASKSVLVATGRLVGQVTGTAQGMSPAVFCYFGLEWQMDLKGHSRLLVFKLHENCMKTKCPTLKNKPNTVYLIICLQVALASCKCRLRGLCPFGALSILSQLSGDFTQFVKGLATFRHVWIKSL